MPKKPGKSQSVLEQKEKDARPRKDKARAGSSSSSATKVNSLAKKFNLSSLSNKLSRSNAVMPSKADAVPPNHDLSSVTKDIISSKPGQRRLEDDQFVWFHSDEDTEDDHSDVPERDVNNKRSSKGSNKPGFVVTGFPETSTLPRDLASRNGTNENQLDNPQYANNGQSFMSWSSASSDRTKSARYGLISRHGEDYSRVHTASPAPIEPKVTRRNYNRDSETFNTLVNGKPIAWPDPDLYQPPKTPRPHKFRDERASSPTI